MSETTRTFIAVSVPAALELRLTRLQERLAGEVPEGRWQTPLPFHITLAFLGDVPHSELYGVCQAVSDASRLSSRFDLTLEGIGAFPGADRPRTVWVGVGGPGLEPLKGLQAAVTSAVARLNYPPEGRPYHPHVTLGRFDHGRRPTRDFAHVVSHFRTWHAGPFPVSEAVIFGSTLTREGPIYAPLGRGPFGRQKPDASP
jgi:2'-5' RNA ligase